MTYAMIFFLLYSCDLVSSMFVTQLDANKMKQEMSQVGLSDTKFVSGRLYFHFET